jgi:hypothetical protein
MNKTEFISNPDKDETVIAHTVNFDGLIDRNKALANEGFHGSKEMRHVAEIPGIVIEQYCFTRGVSWAEFWADQKHIKAILNDSDMAYFRIAPGKV